MNDDAEVFVCGDSRGNGCGRMFDGTAVKQINQLCEFCAEDM